MIEPDIEWEYHSQYLGQNSYSITGEEGEPERAITPPPPTAPELEDPILFAPRVTGICDHLIALMTDEQKAQLKEAARSHQATPSFRHVPPTQGEHLRLVWVLNPEDHHGRIHCILEELQLQHIELRLSITLRMWKTLYFHVDIGRQSLSFRVLHGFSV